MLARRLLIVMLVLLAMSTVAALLAPIPPRLADQKPKQRAPKELPAPAGRTVEATLDASAHRSEVIRLRPNDRLVLRVRSRRPDQVELRGLGLLQTVGPFAPARFDLLAGRPGRHAVRLLNRHRTIGTIAIRRHTGRA